ncbi:MAG: 4Fe-4S binding protein [Deltaproteobacteria bacterium]|nr:4Fe-4S binding protein [Myxococcales bacterium]MDP3220752.1 4Fe-4S binding protein [Deltaproteobacteria bacterium]
MSGGGLPLPIPWLGVVGEVPSLDGAAAPSAPMVIASDLVAPAVAVTPAVASAASSASAGAVTAKPGLLTRAREWLRARTKPRKRPGSGLPARKIIVALRNSRRVSQAFFLFLFLFLLVRTEFRGSFSGGATVRMPYPVEAFLLADPFIALMTFLSSHTVYRALWWSVGMVAVTVIFGRVFCGWICPFGTLHHFFAWLFPNPKSGTGGGRRVRANMTHPYQNVKYYLLGAFLVAAVCGSAIGGLFDPICICVRAIGLAVLPAVSYITGRGLDQVSQTNIHLFQQGSDVTRDALVATVLQPRQYFFHQTWVIGGLLFAVLLANRWIPRFWCRALCPLGATLGLIARNALFGMEKDHSKCTDCNLCLVDCQGADSPQGGVKWKQDECHMCLNCETACPEDVIKFRFLPNRRSAALAQDGLDRRKVIVAAAVGAAALPLARTSDTIDANYYDRLIRPPGSVPERDFMERCIRCAECMKVCPNNALHPAFLESGIEGFWTPILIPRIGYCEPTCVLCGQVCPTGAIQKITEEQKLGNPVRHVEPIKIGTAFYDHGRCLPWSMATPCIVCEEFCPTSPKSIWVEEIDVPDRNGQMVHVQRPHVDPQLCIGCGACEKVCPVQDRPAVYVTSVGESRSRTNVILLETNNYNRPGA